MSHIPFSLGAFLVANLPSASTNSNKIAIVTDDIAYPFMNVPVISDGTVWRRVSDGFPVNAKYPLSMEINYFVANSTTPSVFGETYTQAGTLTNAKDADGVWVNHASAATTGSEGGLQNFGAKGYRYSRKGIFNYFVKTGSVAGDITVCRIRTGLYSSDPMGADSNATVHQAGFRYCPATDGTAFWRTETSDGATEELTATTTAIAADARYHLQIDMTSSTQIRFFINGVLKATHTVKLPGSTTELAWISRVRTLENVAKNWKIQSLRSTWEG